MSEYYEGFQEELDFDLNLELQQLDLQDKRKSSLFWHLFDTKTLALGVNIGEQPASLKETATKVASTIENLNLETKSKLELIKNTKHSCEALFIGDEYLTWIDKNNSRLIYWLFTKFKQNHNYSLLFLNVYGIHAKKESNQDHEFNILSLQIINENPINLKETYKTVIKYITFIPISKSEKTTLLKNLGNIWRDIFIKNQLNWLIQNNHNQCLWAWEYIKSYKSKLELLPLSLPTYPLSPQSNDDYYHFSIAVFDVWCASPETKYIFIQAIKKAWSQKKHRDKLDGKKACSFNLSEATKEQLDYLSKHFGKHKNEILEELINTKRQEVKNK